MSFIDLNNVLLTLSGKTLFNNFNLQLEQGERLALLGASGLGKSSLLKLLTGIHKPLKGRVQCGAQRVGYIFQEPRLLPWLTVEQNIAQVLRPYKLNATEIKAKTQGLLAKVELSDCLDKYPHQLSGGMAQRVSLARAFAIEPDLLLLDEPLSALDPKLKHQITALIKDYMASHQPTLVYVSHHPEDVLPLVDRCLLLTGENRQQEYPVKDRQDIDKIITQFQSKETQ